MGDAEEADVDDGEGEGEEPSGFHDAEFSSVRSTVSVFIPYTYVSYTGIYGVEYVYTEYAYPYVYVYDAYTHLYGVEYVYNAYAYLAHPHIHA